MTMTVSKRASVSVGTLGLGAAALILASAAGAAEPAKDKNACLQRAFGLAERAGKAKLTDDAAKSVAALLAKLESDCQGGDLAKAAQTQADIEKALPAPK